MYHEKWKIIWKSLSDNPDKIVKRDDVRRDLNENDVHEHLIKRHFIEVVDCVDGNICLNRWRSHKELRKWELCL